MGPASKGSRREGPGVKGNGMGKEKKEEGGGRHGFFWGVDALKSRPHGHF